MMPFPFRPSLSTDTPICNLWQEYNNSNNNNNNIYNNNIDNNNKTEKEGKKLHLAPYLQPYRKNNWGGKTLTKAAEKP
jgi:hypothetical protein